MTHAGVIGAAPARRVGRPIPTRPLALYPGLSTLAATLRISAPYSVRPSSFHAPHMPPLRPPAPAPGHSRLPAHVEAANGAVSANTERAIRADLAVFRAWRTWRDRFRAVVPATRADTRHRPVPWALPPRFAAEPTAPLTAVAEHSANRRRRNGSMAWAAASSP